MAHSFAYSTTGLPDQRSVDSWREAMAEVYYRLDVKPRTNDRVNGELLDWQSERIGISEFQADAQRVVRSRKAANGDPQESFVFLFPTRGEMHFQQRNKTGIAGPGEAFLLNSAEAYVVDVPNGSANVTIKIDSSSMVERLPCLRDLCGTTGFANKHLIPALVTLGSQILKLDTASQDSSLEAGVIDLVSAMVEAGPYASLPAIYARPQLSKMLHARLLTTLRTRLHDADLTAETVAQENRISVRYLHKIFHDDGESFGRVLLHERLNRARTIIAGLKGTNRINLAEIAYACGFSSQAHFSATFKARYGEAPSSFFHRDY